MKKWALGHNAIALTVKRTEIDTENGMCYKKVATALGVSQLLVTGHGLGLEWAGRRRYA